MGQSNKSGERNPNNPPNPRKGQSMVPYNPELKYTQDDFKRFQVQARRQARECLLLELGISDLCAVSTPSSRWFVEHAGEDSFPGLINQERGSLCMGKYTDDEIANGVFMHGDMPEHEKHRALLSGNPSSIAWLTAGKERIRWLSRHLESSLSREEHLTKELTGYNEKVWKFLVDNDEYQGYNPEALQRLALEILPEDFVNTKIEEVIAKLKEEGMIEDGVVKRILRVDPPRMLRLSAEETYAREEMRVRVERLAEEIYSGWMGDEWWKPWEVGGNSNKQNEARRLAAEQITSEINKEKSNVPSD